MTPTRHTRLRAAFVAALVLPLAACAAQPAAPSAAPSEPAPITATPAAEPTDPLEEVVTVVLRPDVLELHDDGGAVVAEVDYMGDASEAIATLTTVFAADPVSEPVEASPHFPGAVKHSWDGVSLIETQYDEALRIEGDLDNLIWPRLIALVEAPEVAGVAITSAAGRVGDRADELSTPIDPDLWTCSGWAVETLDVDRADGGTYTMGVSLTFSGATGPGETAPAAGDIVTLLRAPADVAEGCA